MEMELINRVGSELFQDSVRMAGLLGMTQELYWHHVNSEADIELTPQQIVTLLEETTKVQGPAVAEMRNILSRTMIDALLPAAKPAPASLSSARVYKAAVHAAHTAGILLAVFENAMITVLNVAVKENMSIEDVIALCDDKPKP